MPHAVRTICGQNPERNQPHPGPHTLDQLYRELSRLVQALLRRCRTGMSCEQLLGQLHDSLDRLPLSTSEYGRARCHLANIQRYLRADERGAAVYEARILSSLVSFGSQ